jgi:hypothetical protein
MNPLIDISPEIRKKARDDLMVLRGKRHGIIKHVLTFWNVL